MNESQSNSFLAEQPVGALMRKFSLPCILSLLVGALYFMAAADAVTFIVTVPVLVRTDRALRG